MRSKIPSLKCPKENGGCGEDSKFRIAIDREMKRVILDCECGFRTSIPFSIEDINLEAKRGHYNESGKEVIS